MGAVEVIDHVLPAHYQQCVACANAFPLSGTVDTSAGSLVATAGDKSSMLAKGATQGVSANTTALTTLLNPWRFFGSVYSAVQAPPKQPLADGGRWPDSEFANLTNSCRRQSSQDWLSLMLLHPLTKKLLDARDIRLLRFRRIPGSNATAVTG